MKGNPDSVMQKIFACRIRNSGLWNPESRTLKSGTLTVESGVRLKESYRARRGPFFPTYLERSKGFCSQGEGIRNPTDNWKSKFHSEKSGIQYLTSGIHDLTRGYILTRDSLSSSKALSRIIFSTLFRVFSHQIVGKEN